MLLREKNKNLLLRGFDNKIGQDVTLNNPQRTTVKFRKFRQLNKVK